MDQPPGRSGRMCHRGGPERSGILYEESKLTKQEKSPSRNKTEYVDFFWVKFWMQPLFMECFSGPATPTRYLLLSSWEWFSQGQKQKHREEHFYITIRVAHSIGIYFLDLVPWKQIHSLSHIHTYRGLKGLCVILEKKREICRKWFQGRKCNSA